MYKLFIRRYSSKQMAEYQASHPGKICNIGMLFLEKAIGTGEQAGKKFEALVGNSKFDDGVFPMIRSWETEEKALMASVVIGSEGQEIDLCNALWATNVSEFYIDTTKGIQITAAPKAKKQIATLSLDLAEKAAAQVEVKKAADVLEHANTALSEDGVPF
jgi:hypothetical protein